VSVGLLDVTRRLARAGVRVGLAATLDDDRFGRACAEELAAVGVDVGGVRLAPRGPGFFVVDAAGGGLGVIAERGEARDLEIPPAWSSPLLLLSGLSPVTSRAAAFCRAARKARRDGATSVLDLAGSLREWVGRDPRTIAMLVREADVVCCTYVDLAVIGTDAASVRGALRQGATLVIGDDATTTATGAFGEVRVEGRREKTQAAAADACTAAICAELARPARIAESAAARWDRILRASRREAG
jgi:fructokinase/2-dehydro-3-deoxygluconokinase